MCQLGRPRRAGRAASDAATPCGEPAWEARSPPGQARGGASATMVWARHHTRSIGEKQGARVGRSRGEMSRSRHRTGGGGNNRTPALESRHLPEHPPVLAYASKWTGVLEPRGRQDRTDAERSRWTGYVVSPLTRLPRRFSGPTASTLNRLQASRTIEQVHCRDDRGSYPCPVPDAHRLAQMSHDAKRVETAFLAAGGPPLRPCRIAPLVPNPAVRRGLHRNLCPTSG